MPSSNVNSSETDCSGFILASLARSSTRVYASSDLVAKKRLATLRGEKTIDQLEKRKEGKRRKELHNLQRFVFHDGFSQIKSFKIGDSRRLKKVIEEEDVRQR